MWAGVNIKRMKSRDAYHHGDLRNALVRSAARLAGSGGPAAVTIRAAAREVGVTPTAAYRHFANHEALLDAAKHECTRRMAVAMHTRLDATPAERDPVRSAVLRLDAIERGYVDFALAEPGLFRTAFCLGETEEKAGILTGKPSDEDLGVDEPHEMLLGLIDELVQLGFFAEEERIGAAMSAWSLVHGLAMLLIDGPLASIPEADRAAVVEATLTTYARSFWDSHSRS